MITSNVHFLWLLVMGGFAHAVVDWFFQSNWQAQNKMKRMIANDGGKDALSRWLDDKSIFVYNSHWWHRHPAAYVHAIPHALVQLYIFPWWAALTIGFVHLLIDTRVPLVWWGQMMRQTMPLNQRTYTVEDDPEYGNKLRVTGHASLFDIGTEVSIWRDQVAHIIVIAIVAALCVSV